MAKVVGDIAVVVGADVTPLQKGMAGASKSVKRFGKDTDQMGVRVAKVGLAMAAAVAAAGAAFTKLASEVGKVGAEISNLSAIAGVSTTEFQRMAAASSTVGIEQDKLADILKDVNDKIGDFISTGAGPMKDFFENIGPLVGVTAEQFKNLSGPDALQLYVSSLEKAGASQKDMTFYMEALASDATGLLPLLRDNGSEMQRLGDKAAATGRVLSQETVEAADRLNDKLTETKEIMRNQVITAFVGLEDEMIVMADFAKTYAVPALEAIMGAASAAAGAIDGMFKSLQVQGAEGLDTGTIEKSLFNNAVGAGDFGSLLPPPVPASAASAIPTAPTGLNIRTSTGGSGGSSGGGGGGKAPRDFEEEMEQLQAQFLTEQETIQAAFDAQLEQLAEFRAKKIATEEEFNALESDIRQEHADKMQQIDRDAMSAKLSAVAGAFGDLSSLMGSQNKKIFAIGKAAALAEATISGFQAAASAWQKGMHTGGPAVAAAFTAASLAKTGMLISGIASQNIGGGGGGGGGASGGAAASASTAAPAAAQPSTYFNVQLTGGDMFGATQVRSLISSINKEIEDGAVIKGIRAI